MGEKKRTVKDENYYSIFGWMTNPDGMDLSGLELDVYAIIFGMTQSVNKFDGALQYLADFTNTSERGIQKTLARLVEKGYLIKTQVSYNRFTYEAVVKKKKDDEQSSPMTNRVHHDDEQSSPMTNRVHHDDEQSSPLMTNRVRHDDEQSSPNNIDNIDNNINIYISDKKEEKSTPIRHKYGEFKHVRLSDDDIIKLKETYGDELLNKYIKLLDEYIENTGKSYKNHYLTIRNWIKKNLQKDKQSSGAKKSNQFNTFSQRDSMDFDELEKRMTGGTG